MDNKFCFDYQTYSSLTELGVQDMNVVDAAQKACATAYAPYSNFRVGAAALLESGQIVTGSNQESEVFPAGICAERNLLFHHQSHSPEDRIVAIAIASSPSRNECSPCGICRQVLVDVEKRQGAPIRVIMTSHSSATVVGSARELLPFGFTL